MPLVFYQGRGELHGRIAQLMMMARYRHRREALRHAAQLLAELLPEGDLWDAELDELETTSQQRTG